jgi:hypothetical protein
MLPVISFAAPISFEANVPVDHVYTPAGFDSNDNTEIVVTGFLPNLCYKAPKSSVVVKDGKVSIEIKAMKNQLAMGFCADVIVPYIEYINVGVLDKGNYLVAVNEHTNWEKKNKLQIAEASSSSIDEAIYANVEEIEKSDEGSRKVLLKGYNPSDCFELKEIVVKDNGIDTYSVLPKMKQVKAFCPKKMIPFTYEFEVPQNLEADKVLLHVRVMDGRSVNAFFNNKPLDM